VHQFKFADLNKMAPTNPLKMIAFFEQCQATDKAVALLRRLPRTRSGQKRRKWLNFLSRVAMNQATGSIKVVNIQTTIKATNAIATIANPTVVIETINTTIALVATTRRTQRATSPMTRRMIASKITPRKRATRPCIMTSPLCQEWGISMVVGVVLVQDLLHDLVLGLALAQAAGATTIIMWPKMTAGQMRPSSVGTRTPP
jgi:hypothetical protein